MIEGQILEAKLFASVDVPNSILQLTFHQYWIKWKNYPQHLITLLLTCQNAICLDFHCWLSFNFFSTLTLGPFSLHLHLLSYSQSCIDECDFPVQSAALNTHLTEFYLADLRPYLKTITLILNLRPGP